MRPPPLGLAPHCWLFQSLAARDLDTSLETLGFWRPILRTTISPETGTVTEKQEFSGLGATRFHFQGLQQRSGRPSIEAIQGPLGWCLLSIRGMVSLYSSVGLLAGDSQGHPHPHPRLPLAAAHALCLYFEPLHAGPHPYLIRPFRCFSVSSAVHTHLLCT